ncbi:hypothetical protein D9M68_800300 [compost metagenome]
MHGLAGAQQSPSEIAEIEGVARPHEQVEIRQQLFNEVGQDQHEGGGEGGREDHDVLGNRWLVVMGNRHQAKHGHDRHTESAGKGVEEERDAVVNLPARHKEYQQVGSREGHDQPLETEQVILPHPHIFESVYHAANDQEDAGKQRKSFLNYHSNSLCRILN